MISHWGERWEVNLCVISLYVTYLEHSQWTPGHLKQLRRLHPSTGSPQISPQSSSVSSEGPRHGSTRSPDVPFCSTPPLSHSLSAETRSQKGNHVFSLNILGSAFKAAAEITVKKLAFSHLDSCQQNAASTNIDGNRVLLPEKVGWIPQERRSLNSH